MTAEPTPVNIFYCYAHEDKELRDSLDKSLSALKRNGQIIGWHDRQISPGQDWANQIDNNLNKADIIFLLVSPDFMYSDYCYGIEMKRALERQMAGEARVIPIVLRTTDLEDAPFSHLQMLPTDAVPVMKWANKDDAFYDIVKGIRQALKELRIERLIAQGRALRKSERFDEALSLLEQAIQLDSHNAGAFYEKGSVFLDREGSWKDAISAFDATIRFDPTHAQAYFGKGRVLYYLAQYSEALAAFGKAIHCNPEKVDFYSWQGASFEALGKNEEALARYEQAAHFDNLPLLWKQAELLMKLNRREEVIAVLEHILSLNKDDARAFRWMGSTLNAIEHYEEAVEAYDKAIPLYSNKNPHKANCYNGKGNALYQLHRLEEALVAYDKATQLQPEWSAPYRNKGNVYEQLAQECHKKADELEGKGKADRKNV